MAKHTLHKTIGDLIKKHFETKLILSPECGGKQNIPLFINNRKSNATEIANADMILFSNGNVTVIIEIEETNVTPNQISGKLLTSSLSKWHLHDNKNISLLNSPSILFIQIVNSSLIKNNSSKIKQWDNLKRELNNILPIGQSKINKYRLFYMNLEDFKHQNKIVGELINCIRNHISK